MQRKIDLVSDGLMDITRQDKIVLGLLNMSELGCDEDEWETCQCSAMQISQLMDIWI